MSVVAIIAAAGQGTRLGTGGPKALVDLAGEPLLVHAARAIRGSGAVDSIVVTAPSAHVRLFDGILTAAGIQARGRPPWRQGSTPLERRITC